MIALALIWLAAAVFAMSAAKQSRDPRWKRWLIVIGAVLVGLAFAAQVLA